MIKTRWSFRATSGLIFLGVTATLANGLVGKTAPTQPAAAMADEKPVVRKSLRRANASEAVASAQEPKSSIGPAIDEARAQLNALASCSDKGDCQGGDSSDPKARYYASAQDMSAILERLRAYVGNGSVTDDEIAAIARKYVAFSEDHVREKALAIFSALPASDENATAILNGLRDCYDPAVFTQAIAELSRYQDSDVGQTVTSFLQSQILTGSPFVEEAVINSLPKILSDENLAAYEDTLSQLPAGSANEAAMKKAIDGYKEHT